MANISDSNNHYSHLHPHPHNQRHTTNPNSMSNSMSSNSSSSNQCINTSIMKSKKRHSRHHHNIVLISAATVLLATNKCCCLAFMSSSSSLQQPFLNNHHHHQYKRFPITPTNANNIDYPTNNNVYSFPLYSSQRNQENWSKRATSVSSDTNTANSSSTSSSSSTTTKKRTESPLGVRRRVRSVLQKAKRRTGIRNISDDDDDDDEIDNVNMRRSTSSRPPPSTIPTRVRNSSSSSSSSSTTTGISSGSSSNAKVKPLKTVSTASNIVADAASIGGLGAVLVDDESGKIDVALDYIPLPKDEGEDNQEEVKDEEQTKLDNEIEKEQNEIKDEDNSQGKGKLATSSSSSGGGCGSGGSGSSNTTMSTSSVVTKVKKSSPASTYSPSTIKTKPLPEDALVPAKPSKSSNDPSTNKSIPTSPTPQSSSSSSSPLSSKITEVDALKADVSAAFSMPPPPLPFTLPNLTPEQNQLLLNGERVQFQSDMGREGSGFVAVDVKAPASVIWECLLDFYSYPQTIPTVRDIQMFTNTHLKQDYYAEQVVDRVKYEDGTLATLKHGVPSVTRAAFTLSKFRLKIAAIHKYRIHPQGDYMIFTLDPACTNVVLQSAKGVWHTQSNPDGRGEVSLGFDSLYDCMMLIYTFETQPIFFHVFMITLYFYIGIYSRLVTV
jgi:hypothetical protein